MGQGTGRAELGRAVQTALRSSALPLRTSTLRWKPCRNLAAASLIPHSRTIASSPSLCSAKGNNGAANSSQYSTWPSSPSSPSSSSSSSWGVAPRTPRIDQADGFNIKKPEMSTYDQMRNSESPDDFDVLRQDTDFAAGIDLELSDLSDTLAKTLPEPVVPSGPSMRLVPRTGRTVYVNRNVDVARSFKLLAVQVAQNKLRQDFQNQRYHMRPGLKRKKLKSERYRRRFMKGFKGAVKRVQELTRQGW
ncbi:hypothetical protein F4775DRAFT_597772 [Biscogniauxia sp. FL1348]|nr:hypothetical protein F4775DRAFT_597772 [Biscogniauxia sp. FL1348]